MMNKMIVANLVHRPIRSLISVLAITLEVTLILLVVALCFGILEDSKKRQSGIGADVIVQPPGSSNLIGITSAPMPVKVGEILRKLPHVVSVAPVMWQLTSSGSLEVIYGIDLASYESMGGGFRYLAGQGFQGPNDVLVDDVFADAKRARVGDSVDILNHKFRIAGIVEHGKGARKFLPLGTLQDLTGAQGKASVFYVKLDEPASADEVVREVKAVPGMESYAVRSMREYLSLMTPSSLPGFNPFINTVIGVAMVIGFLVIFQSMYTAVMERTREIGILKALGASKTYVLRVILRESLVLAVTGIAMGLVVSTLATAVIVQRIPTIRLQPLTPGWALRVTVIAIVGAMLGAIYPAIKAARKDPIDALAYE